jgi:hypothetical protein
MLSGEDYEDDFIEEEADLIKSLKSPIFDKNSSQQKKSILKQQGKELPNHLGSSNKSQSLLTFNKQDQKTPELDVNPPTL